jgi:DNA invertase Pin-like site-specific DNA recombinase
MRVLGYARVSTAEQGMSGAGLEAQCAGIRAECEHRGWQLVECAQDVGFSGKNLKRPALLRLLDALRDGEADALVVAKLDRLSRSMRDFTQVMAQAEREGWALVVLDMNVDTTTPAGEMSVNVLASFARFEHRIISQRTKDALAVKRAEGKVFGPKPRLPLAVAERIHEEREYGASYRAIANALNADGIPTAHGGRQWWPSTVRGVLRSQAPYPETPDAKPWGEGDTTADSQSRHAPVAPS